MLYLFILNIDIIFIFSIFRNKILLVDSYIEFIFQVGNLIFLNLSIYCCNIIFFSNNYFLMKIFLNKCIFRNLKILNILKNGIIWVCCFFWVVEGINRCGIVFIGGCFYMYISVILFNLKKKFIMYISNIFCVKKKNIYT